MCDTEVKSPEVNLILIPGRIEKTDPDAQSEDSKVFYLAGFLDSPDRKKVQLMFQSMDPKGDYRVVLDFKKREAEMLMESLGNVISGLEE